MLVESDRMKSSRFPKTQWSLVGRAARGEDANRAAALTSLLAAYRPGLRRFLIEGRRLPSDVADDLLQEFITEKILARGLLRAADPERGQFRNFLLKSLNNFVNGKLRRQHPAMARTVGLELADDVAAEPEAGLQCFEREWVNQVARAALTLMQAECDSQGRTDLWEIFRIRVVDPVLNDTAPMEYGEIVARFGLASPRQAINLLASSKRAFARHLRSAVRGYIGDEADVDREILDLREICLR
jgi:hypothetical protein